MNPYILLLISVLMGSIAQIPLKSSAIKQKSINLNYFVNIRTITGYSLMLFATVLSFIAIRSLPLKAASIMESTAYVYVLLIGYFMFKERLNFRKLIACLLIVGGIIVFNGTFL